MLTQMDDATRKSIQTRLEAERASLLAELKSESGATPDESDGKTAKFPDYGDSDEENASEVADFATNLPVERQFEESLLSVEAALKRLADGTYGNCSHCGKPIDDERLIAMPTAQTCVEHANS
jgi:RNA polymerase-binding transcription factor DksA